MTRRNPPAHDRPTPADDDSTERGGAGAWAADVRNGGARAGNARASGSRGSDASRGAARPTIADVAREAGVSTGTVSRVLNERPGVHARTRESVLAAMRRLAYEPDVAARELSFGQAPRIGLHVAPGIRRLTPFFMVFLESLIGELQTGGYRLEEIPSRADGMPAKLTDGVVLFGAHDDDPRIPYLQRNGVPFVLIGHGTDIRWVVPDDRDGGLQATRHLLRLGHREIAHLSGYMSNQAFFDRYAGHGDALREEGLEPLRELLFDGGFTTLGGYRAVRSAWERGVRFSALFAASDEMAVGAIQALEDLGLDVPLDVSVVGFDDLPEVGERLTTVRQDIEEIASVAVALLKEGLRDEPVRHQVVPVRLVVRGTTARRR